MGAVAAAIIGGAALSAGGQYLSSSSAASAQSAKQGSATALLRKLSDSGQLGKVPDAALYSPVDFTDRQRRTIAGNIQNEPDAAYLSSLNNQSLTQQQITHANTLMPGWSQMMQTSGADAQALLSGKLPYSDLLQEVGNQAQQTGGMNIPGVGGPATLRDLGVSSLQAMQQGQSMMGNMTSMANQMSPASSLMTPQSMNLDPATQIVNAMNQNQLTQQSQQNANNLRAAAQPGALIQAQAALGFALSPTPTPNYAAMLGSGGTAANQLASMGYANNTAANGPNGGADPATGVMNSGYYNSQAAAQAAYGGPSGSIFSAPAGSSGYYVNPGYTVGAVA